MVKGELVEMTEYIEKKCPECGRKFKFPKCGYEPKTCADFDCMYKYAHRPENFTTLMEALDVDRKKAGI